ncbi:synaptotagmin-16 isoform X3 [Hydra vulgaris]|uniref:Synaptotagmin-16 isoform X3 n=1 Tax=Hydra vulgaris TaxID=6087 RepID=A0ABM4CHJ4_HYDVU
MTMTENLPIPAIVFLCVICGCMVVLVIVYQLLQRDMCCKIEVGGRSEDKDKNGYKEIVQNFYDLDENEAFTTDEDPISRKSSRRSSRRSSCDIAASQSGCELQIGEDASTYSDQMNARSSFRQDDAYKHGGKIFLDFNYSPSTQQMVIIVIKAADIPSRARGGSSAVQVRLVLLPAKHHRFKTKVRPAANPVFNETFIFQRIDQFIINQSSLRLRIYGQERYNQGRVIGELVIPLKELELLAQKPEDERRMWKTLKPKTLTSSDSLFDVSDTNSVTSFGSQLGSNPSLYGGSGTTNTGCHGNTPELLISLCYTSLTGRLTVEVLKATNLKVIQLQRAPDTYVKVSMFNAIGHQLAKSKTSIRRSMYDPDYKETFVFQIIEFDLSSVSLMFSIIVIKKMRRKEILGWFSLGKDNTSEDELKHWREMLHEKGKPVRRWHVLSAVGRSFDDEY